MFNFSIVNLSLAKSNIEAVRQDPNMVLDDNAPLPEEFIDCLINNMPRLSNEDDSDIRLEVQNRNVVFIVRYYLTDKRVLEYRFVLDIGVRYLLLGDIQRFVLFIPDTADSKQNEYTTLKYDWTENDVKTLINIRENLTEIFRLINDDIQVYKTYFFEDYQTGC